MQQPRFWSSKRFFVAILLCLGTLNMYALHANLNIAIVEMTRNKTIIEQNQTIVQKPEFDWDSQTKGIILGAFYYGFLISPFSGYFAMKFGGSTVIAVGTLMATIQCLLTPTVIRLNYYVFLVFRAFEGMPQCLALASIVELWLHWSPPQDRSRLMALGYNGIYAGPAVLYFTCGYIIHAFGWAGTFYCIGCISLIWCAIWIILVPNDPASDKWISKEELLYIQQNKTEEKPQNISLLWKNVLLSKCVWSLGVLKIVYGMGNVIVVTCLPMYIKDVTNSEIREIGIYSAIPNIISTFSIPLFGYLVDGLENSKYFTTTQIHKTAMTIGSVGGAALLFTLNNFSSNFTLFILCLILFKVFLSIIFVTIQLNCFSIDPRSATVVVGFIGIFYMLSTICGPVIIGHVVKNHTREEWNYCITTMGILLLIGAGVNLIFGSSEPQPWNETLEKDESVNKTAS